MACGECPEFEIIYNNVCGVGGCRRPIFIEEIQRFDELIQEGYDGFTAFQKMGIEKLCCKQSLIKHPRISRLEMQLPSERKLPVGINLQATTVLLETRANAERVQLLDAEGKPRFDEKGRPLYQIKRVEARPGKTNIYKST